MSPDPDGTFDLLGDYYAHMQEFNLAVSLQKYLPKVKEPVASVIRAELPEEDE